MRISTNSGITLAALLFALLLVPSRGWATQTQNCPTEPAQNAAIASGETYYGTNCTISTTGDVDAFQFDASAGDTYKIVAGLGGSPQRNICLNLYAPGLSSKPIFSGCTNAFVVGGNAAVSTDQNLTVAGVYTIAVTESSNGTVTYGLSLERLNPAPPDGVPLVLSQNTSGKVNPLTAQDAFTFYGATSGTYEVAASLAAGASSNVCFQVYQPNGASAVSGSCTNAFIVGGHASISADVTPSQNGTYLVVVYVSGNDGTVNYNLEVSCLLGTCPVTPPESPLQFVPVTPCRVVDTRNPDGPFGGPELVGGGSRTFNIPASACNIPSSAAAYSLNVTVVPDAQLGYLTVWPAGQSQPLVSTLNSDGRIKANAAIVPAGSSGGINVFASNSTQLVIDIDGYFVPAGTSTLAFYPMTPCRVADTRNATSPLGGPYLAGAMPRAFPVLSSSCSIPSTATAYSLNFTAVPHGALGYISVWPSGQAQPLVSTLNALTGVVTANAAIVPAGSAGDISVFASNDTDLVIDVNGYFAPPASGGLSLYTLTPCRVLDTRSSSGQFSGTLAVNVTGSACGALTSAAQAFVLNATVVPPGALGYLTLWPNGGAQPTVSTLNALDAAVTSNLAIVPTTNGSINAFASNPTQLILDISAFFAP